MANASTALHQADLGLAELVLPSQGEMTAVCEEVNRRCLKLLDGLDGTAVNLESTVRVEPTPGQWIAGVPVPCPVNSTPATFQGEKTSITSSSWTAPTGKPARKHAVGIGQGPISVASTGPTDLRIVLTAMRVVSNLERMGAWLGTSPRSRDSITRGWGFPNRSVRFSRG